MNFVEINYIKDFETSNFLSGCVPILVSELVVFRPKTSYGSCP
jgi:hypothetical protein